MSLLTPIKKIYWRIFVAIDERLKFPALKKGETGIQLGFDMSAPVTSDLFLMAHRVGPGGKVIGIDPDPRNHAIAKSIIEKNNYPVQLMHKAVYDHAGTMTLLLGEKASWNQLNIFPPDEEVNFQSSTIQVEMQTLDAMVAENNMDISRIGHINITVNGAEYGALKGMEHILSAAENMAITVIAGRADATGTINGKNDYEAISELLQSHGFTTRFVRMEQLFWWGFIVNFLMKRRWIFRRSSYGVVMAVKGNKKIPFYQSYS